MNNGAYNSYYNTPPLATISASGNNADTDAINVATVLTSLNTTRPTRSPASRRPSSPVTIQCIVFGAIFEPGASGSDQSDAVSLMQSISTLGNTVFPSSSTDPTNGYKWCIGTLAQRQSKLQTAFVTAMDKEVSIILVPNTALIGNAPLRHSKDEARVRTRASSFFVRRNRTLFSPATVPAA